MERDTVQSLHFAEASVEGYHFSPLRQLLLAVKLFFPSSAIQVT